MTTIRTTLILVLGSLALTACTAEHGDRSVTANVDDAAPLELPSDLEFLADHRVFEPQITALEDESVVLTWRERGDSGSDLYAAVRLANGEFGPPVRLNNNEQTVESYAHDGMRAAIAVAPGNRLAVAWSDSRAQIRAAISEDGGRSFLPSFRLDQADAPAYRV